MCYKCCNANCVKDRTAFGLILSENVELDSATSNKNIKSVERLELGRYKITFKNGTFTCGKDKLKPVIHVSPCESQTIPLVIGTDEEGNPITLSEFFPTEQSVVLCNFTSNTEAIITTGRTPILISATIPVIGPPEVRNNIDFYFYAVQTGC